MAIEHRLTSTDSLRTLAQFYMGNSNRWQAIADFNGLSYPYIVDNDSTRKNLLHGNGYVKVRRTNFRNARTVPRGWQLYTELDVFSGQLKVYEVTEDVVFPAGSSEAYLHIRATTKGVFGNLPIDTYLFAGNGFVENGFPIDECVTVERFVGGQDVRVLAFGEYIYIPNEVQEIEYTDHARMVAFVGEEDIALDAEGEFYVDGFGDIASVQGADNIVQGVNHRLMTERGALELHPMYGSNIHYLIGQAQSAYRLKLIELDIYETLGFEDRITDIKVHRVYVEGAIVYVDVSFKLRTVNRSIERSLVLDYSGRQAS